MIDPNFLIIGAQKSGTSWLAKMVRQHPDIFMPAKKELHFFNLKENYKKGMDWYRSQFAGYSGEKLLGEATPNYFSFHLDEEEIQRYGMIPNIPELIYKHYPDIKLILCLRDPVRRAISSYYHHIRARRISPKTSITIAGHEYGIIKQGYYFSQLVEWLKFFTLDRFLILIYEYDILVDKKNTMRLVYRFLGVNEEFKPQKMNKKYGPASGSSYLYIHYYLPILAKLLNSFIPFLQRINFPKIDLTAEEVNCLSDLYKEENQKLADLIERNLTPWEYKI